MGMPLLWRPRLMESLRADLWVSGRYAYGAGLALSGCPLDGQADAEMFGLDSSSPSKHKMACMWCNSRPRPGLSVTQEGRESSRKTRRVTRHFSRRP